MPNSCPNEVSSVPERKRVVVEFRDPNRGGFADQEIEIGDDRLIRPIFREGREWLFSHTEVPVNAKNEPIGPTVYVFSERKLL
jgi:hypothetical protein